MNLQLQKAKKRYKMFSGVKFMICKKCKKDVPDGRYCIACGADQSASKKTRPRTRPNGTGTAYKRGSTWTAQVTVGIKRDPDTGRVQQVRRTKGGFKTKREALEFCMQLANAAMPKKHVTFGDLWEQYEKTKFRQLSASKQCSYRTALKRIGDMIYTRIDAVTIADLQGLVDGLTFYCAQDIKSILRHMYRIAMMQGWTSRDLSKYIVLPPKNEHERTPFSDEEIRAIWRGYDGGDTWAGYILLMIYTGMMPGELLHCRKDMIHLDSHQIIGAGLKTAERKNRPIVIADFLMPVVQALIDYTGDAPLLCDTYKRAFYKKYYDCLDRCGCRRLTPYSCRHTTATACAVGAKIAPSVIQRIMRHAKLSTTQLYIHPDESAVLDAINTLRPDQGSPVN
nr:MAG TPA: Integrase [Caudoviricetes sp.]